MCFYQPMQINKTDMIIYIKYIQKNTYEKMQVETNTGETNEP